MVGNQNLNPPQAPLVRGDEAVIQSVQNAERDADVLGEKSSQSKRVADAPPLLRGGWEGLGFLPYNKSLTALARENRKNPTHAELKMWREILSRRQFSDYKFLRQKPIEHFIVDFYCAELRWVIELDRDSHAEQKNYDERRTALLQKHGLQVIRYDNDDVMNNVAGVYDDLMRRLG